MSRLSNANDHEEPAPAVVTSLGTFRLRNSKRARHPEYVESELAKRAAVPSAKPVQEWLLILWRTMPDGFTQKLYSDIRGDYRNARKCRREILESDESDTKAWLILKTETWKRQRAEHAQNQAGD
jgi:hypothetical protein